MVDFGWPTHQERLRNFFVFTFPPTCKQGKSQIFHKRDWGAFFVFISTTIHTKAMSETKQRTGGLSNDPPRKRLTNFFCFHGPPHQTKSTCMSRVSHPLNEIKPLHLRLHSIDLHLIYVSTRSNPAFFFHLRQKVPKNCQNGQKGPQNGLAPDLESIRLKSRDL